MIFSIPYFCPEQYNLFTINDKYMHQHLNCNNWRRKSMGNLYVKVHHPTDQREFCFLTENPMRKPHAASSQSRDLSFTMCRTLQPFTEIKLLPSWVYAFEEHCSVAKEAEIKRIRVFSKRYQKILWLTFHSICEQYIFFSPV